MSKEKKFINLTAEILKTRKKLSQIIYGMLTN